MSRRRYRTTWMCGFSARSFTSLATGRVSRLALDPPVI